MTKRLLGIIAAGALVLSGCSFLPSKNSGSTSTTLSNVVVSTSTTIPYTWPPNLNANPTDVSTGLAISAQQTDFPAGWNSNTQYPTTTPNDAVIDEAFIQCMFGSSPSPLSAYVVSPVFASGDGSVIAQSFVRVVASSTQARTDFANFKPTRAASCEAAMYNRQFGLPKGTKIIGKKFGYDPPPTIPSDTIVSPDNSTDVIAIRFFVSPQDASAVYEDMFAYGKGRYEIVELFQGSQGNPDVASEASALTAIKGRAAAQDK